MSAWTPGPWRVETGTTLIWGHCNQDDHSSYGMGYPVAEAQMQHRWQTQGRPTDEEIDANARLIAAAPEMAEALDALSVGIENDDGVLIVNNPSAAKIGLAQARAILARIKGAS